MTAKRRFTEEEVKLIHQKYEGRWSQRKIGELLNTSESTIKRFLVSQGVEIRSSKETQHIFTDEQKQKIVSLYVNDGLSFKAIGDKYGRSFDAIRNVILELAKDKIRPRNIKGRGAGKSIFNDQQQQEIIRLYRDELLSFEAIGERMGTSFQPVKNVIKRLAPEIVRGTSDTRKIFNDEQETEICRLYTEEGLTTIELGKKYGTTPSTINNVLVRESLGNSGLRAA